MSILLPCSLALLAAAAAASLRIAARSGEARVALLGGALLLGAAALALALVPAWHRPLRFDVASGAAAAGLLAGVLGLLAVRAFGRTVDELERAEALHWESMEAVRALGEGAGRRELALEERLTRLLELGCAQLGLELGWVSRVQDDRWEVLALHAPDGAPLAAGAAFALAEGCCAATLASERPLAFARASELRGGGGPAPAFEAYLGARVHVEGECFGTLAFASSAARDERFTATHKDLAALMALWVGGELERDHLRRARRVAPPPSPAPPRPRAAARAADAAAALELNPALERLERRIRRAAGAGVEVELRLAPGALCVAPPRVALEVVVLNLVRGAAAALAHGGRLRIATAEGPPGAAPPGAPAGYATVSLSARGPALDAGALARLLEPDDAAGAAASLDAARAPLSPSLLQRLLQRSGADLAVAVEPARGATLTVFLPRAAEPAAAGPLWTAPSAAPAQEAGVASS